MRMPNSELRIANGKDKGNALKVLRLLVLSFAILHSSFSISFAKDVAAVITQIVGALYVKEGGAAYRRAKKGEFVYEGTTLKTGKGDRAAISFVSGTEVKINEGTTYTIRPTRANKKGQGNDSRLTTGRIWFKVLKKGTKFDIKTPVAAVSVRGTEGDLLMSGNVFRAACYEGAFRLSSYQGGEESEDAQPEGDAEGEGDGSLVSAGQMGMVTGGKPPIVQQLDKKENWQEQVNVYQKGTLKFVPTRSSYEFGQIIEVELDLAGEGEVSGAVYVDASDASLSITGKNGEFLSGAVPAKLKDGDKLFVKVSKPGYFNVAGNFDGYEVSPGRFQVTPAAPRTDGPKEREMEVEIQDEKGEKKKIRLKFKQK